MRISMIELVSSHGGCNYYDYALLRAFGKLGCETTLYTSCELKFNTDSEKNINVKYTYNGLFDQKNKIKKLFVFLIKSLKTIREIRSSRADIVHFQIYAVTFLEYFIVWLCKKNRLKVMVTVHDVESFNKENSKFVTKRFYAKVDALIVHNKISYDTLVNYLISLNESKSLIDNTYIAHHGSYIGLLPSKISKKQAKDKFNVPLDTFVFLFFGQIKRVKGLDILLEAYAKLLKNTEKNVTLLIAGKVWKDDISTYEHLIEKNALNNNIILNIKYIPDEEIADYYSVADCVVLPYKKIFQSGVLLMAQSYMVPVLVSDLQGMTEIVEDGNNGFVFHSEDEDNLAMKMKDVIESNNLETIVNNAYNKLKSEYDWNLIAKQQLEIMEHLINE